jgi:hypothetical protein
MVLAAGGRAHLKRSASQVHGRAIAFAIHRCVVGTTFFGVSDPVIADARKWVVDANGDQHEL